MGPIGEPRRSPELLLRLTHCFQHSLIQPAFHSRHSLLMLLDARFVAGAAQTRVLLVILICCRCYAGCLYVCCCRFYGEGSTQKVGWRWATGRGRLAEVPCVGRPGLVSVERAVRIGGGIGGGDTARRLPSFSAAPTLSSPRSVINLASEILNLAPPAYRFFLFQVALSNLPLSLLDKSLYL
jgi:hypothetical protein